MCRFPGVVLNNSSCNSEHSIPYSRKYNDNNNDGKLNFAEVTSHFKSTYDAKYDAGSVEGFFKNLDNDSDGSVNADEFKEFVMGSPYQPSGTSILRALEGASVSSDLITYDPRAETISKEDVIVAVVGENPYAEGVGDNPTIGLSSFDSSVLNRCYKSGNKLVVIILKAINYRRPYKQMGWINCCMASRNGRRRSLGCALWRLFPNW